MKEQALAIFDFDGTMIRGDSIVHFLRFAVSERRLSFWALPCQMINALLGLLGFRSAEGAKSYALRFLRRMTLPEAEAFCKAFCRDVLLPRLYPPALRRVEEHRAQGMALVLVSASPDIYLRHMAPLLALTRCWPAPRTRGASGPKHQGREKVRGLPGLAERPGAADGQRPKLGIRG